MGGLYKKYNLSKETMCAIELDIINYWKEVEQIRKIKIDEIIRSPFTAILCIYLMLNDFMRNELLNKQSLAMRFRDLYYIIVKHTGININLINVLESLIVNSRLNKYYTDQDYTDQYLIYNDFVKICDTTGDFYNYTFSKDSIGLFIKYTDKNKYINYYPIDTFIISSNFEHFVRYFGYKNIILSSNDSISNSINKNISVVKVKKVALDMIERCKNFIIKSVKEDVIRYINKSRYEEKLYNVSIKSFIEESLENIFNYIDLKEDFRINVNCDLSTIALSRFDGIDCLDCDIKASFVKTII